MGGMTGWVLAVHGGAGAATAALPTSRLTEAERALAAALRAGGVVLGEGGAAVDGVVEAVKVLEDDPVFNAGRGSVLTAEGRVEMDAAVADGHLRRAGAVAACRGVRNPVEAARAVLAHTDHVLLVGETVTQLAKGWGLAVEPEEWFVPSRPPAVQSETVGAVALDDDGHLAAATSTGGRAGQLAGRVGDSPIVGAGIWADDGTCAVSATGHGEAFVLAAFAHEVDALLRLAGADLGTACERALVAVAARGGKGGCVALDRTGRLVLPFTSDVMFRGWTSSSGRLVTAVLPDDVPDD